MSAAGMAIADGSQTGICPSRQRLLDLLRRAGRRKPFVPIEDDVAELLHGEDRHGVRGRVGEAEALLCVAHLVGERHRRRAR